MKQLLLPVGADALANHLFHPLLARLGRMKARGNSYHDREEIDATAARKALQRVWEGRFRGAVFAVQPFGAGKTRIVPAEDLVSLACPAKAPVRPPCSARRHETTSLFRSQSKLRTCPLEDHDAEATSAAPFVECEVDEAIGVVARSKREADALMLLYRYSRSSDAAIARPLGLSPRGLGKMRARLARRGSRFRSELR